MGNIGDTDKKDVCNKVLTLWDKGIQCRTKYDSDRKKNYNLWKGLYEETFYHGRSQIVVPVAYSAVETILSRVHDGVFGHYPFFNLVGQGNDSLSVEDLQKIATEQLYEHIRFPAKFIGTERSLAIEGTGVSKIYWKKNTERITRLVRQKKKLGGFIDTGKYEAVPKDVENILYDDAEIEHKDLDYISIDPDATPYSEPNWVIESTLVKKEFLLANMKSDKNPEGFYEKMDLSKLAEVGDILSTMGDRTSQQKQGYMLREFWGKWDLDGSGFQIQCLIVTLNDSEILYMGENPFWHNQIPYDISQWIPDKKSIYGFSLIDPIRSINYEINDTHNQAMDCRTYLLNPMALVLKHAGIIPSDLKVRPMGFIRTNIMEGFKYLTPPDFTVSAYNSIKYLETLVQDITGATKYMHGTDASDLNRTATGIISIIREANKRLRLISETQIEQKMINPMLRKLKILNEQYMTNKRYFRSLGKTVSREDMIGDHEFKAFGTQQMGLQEVRQGQLIQLLGYLVKYPNSQITIAKLLKKLWEGWGNSDAEEVFKDLMTPQTAPEIKTGGVEKLITPNVIGAGGLPETVSPNEINVQEE